jgi:urease subunit gamma/beta
MATIAQVKNWSAPSPPTSVVPEEAFEVGESERIGAIDFAEGAIEINVGRETRQIEIVNTGDRPIQVGAHYHLFEVNRALAFDREAAFGFRLDIPSGTAVRFEPGQSRMVQVTRFAGAEVSMGMNGLTNGSMRNELTKAQAIQRARQHGYSFREDVYQGLPRPDRVYADSPAGEHQGRKS